MPISMPSAARGVAAEICSLGGNAHDFEVDVADAGAVEKLVEFAVQKCGGLDMAVNNAGISGTRNTTAEYPLEDWHKLININLNGVFYCMKYEIAAILGRGGGAIVNMSSILGSVGLPSAPAYTAAKHAVVGLTKVAAMEHARRVFASMPLVRAGSTPRFCRIIWRRQANSWWRFSPWAGTGSRRRSRLSLLPAIGTGQFHHGSYHLVDGGYTAR